MRFRVIIVHSAEKALTRIPEREQKKVRRKLKEIALNPFIGKKLQGELAGNYAVYAWPYRIMYRIEQKILTVYIVKIGHRQGVYK